MASSGIDYELLIDAGAVQARLEEGGQSFTRYRRQWIVKGAKLIQGEIVKRAPVGVAGLAGQGIQGNVSIDYDGDQASALVGPNENAPYAEGVEKGTRPHYVPHGPDSSLAQWAELKGLNVYAVAKGIEKRGTKPHPFVGPAYDAVKDEVVDSFTEGVDAYLLRFARG